MLSAEMAYTSVPVEQSYPASLKCALRNNVYGQVVFLITYTDKLSSLLQYILCLMSPLRLATCVHMQNRTGCRKVVNVQHL